MSTEPAAVTPFRQSVAMAGLVFAGEAIFFLPFVIARIFRPTLLSVFGITNLQLGAAFSAYGIVAMLMYFPGGLIADRFSARRLMASALLMTALGGLCLSSIPNFLQLIWLYAFWGITTILLFWAAMIRTTRQWGGDRSQGFAFGLLDAGRGLTAAAIGSITVLVFGAMLPDDFTATTVEQRESAFRMVILSFTGVTALAASMVWMLVPPIKIESRESSPDESIGLLSTIQLPGVWAQAIVILCAYVCYKGLDDVSLYAREAMGFDEVSAARVATLSMWMRPPAALAAGFIADRWRVSSMTMVSFAMIAIGSVTIASGSIENGALLVFYLTIMSTSAAVFALRGLYFAIMHEAAVPFKVTGTAVGIVSAVGYTPDVFMGPAMGYLLDRSPGPAGHHHVFLLIAAFAVSGLLATLFIRDRARLR